MICRWILPAKSKTRIAVISPFLDKQHGTERCVVEQVERLARDYEVHVYSNRVQDLDLSRIVWHRVPRLPGPHLFAYCWWIVANYLVRWWDRKSGGLRFDLIYTPGINCFDADVISVHIVFAEFRRQVRDALKFNANPVRSWPLLLHRRIYYRLVIALERMIYGGKRALLTVVSAKVARDLKEYGRADAQLPVIYHGIDGQRFNVEARRKLRASARAALGLLDGVFCLLLVGNDWKKKGLSCVLEALGGLGIPSIRLLVVGNDTAVPYRSILSRLRLENRVAFLPLRPDVEFYYAAADLYVGPSLEDAFGMPPLEAMACGVPSIVSSQSGISEIITDGVDGFILADSHDSRRLAELIDQLHRNEALRHKIGEAGAKTAEQYSWDGNVAKLKAIFEQVLEHRQNQRRKSEAKVRIAVVSPFLDRRHGTERRASELVERFARDYGYEVHIYSQQIQDIPGVERFKRFRTGGNGTGKGIEAENQDSAPRAGRMLWHKLPKLPGPHLFNYLWWFASNHLWRWWDARFRGGKCDLVYSPGINCLNADVVSVHIIFAEFYRQVRSRLALRANPFRTWPRIIHRRLYYRLIMALEQLVYSGERPRLAVISRKTYDDVVQRWRHDEPIPVVYGGLDEARFNVPRRVQMRPFARRDLELADSDFGLLMIGNDWKKKGLECLLEALGRLQNSSVKLLVAGQDSIGPYRDSIDHYGLIKQLNFLPIRSDVEFYYAATDVYVCPSLEDAFAYPPFEAMACGLPVIVSSQAGVSELIADGKDGLLLKDPRDAETLARLIGKLYNDPAVRTDLGENAARTASQYTWKRNAEQFKMLFEEVMHGKAAV